MPNVYALHNFAATSKGIKAGCPKCTWHCLAFVGINLPITGQRYMQEIYTVGHTF